MAKDWFQLSGGNYGGNYFNHPEYGYDTQSLSAASSSNLGFWLDPTGTVASAWNDITGVSAQSREFAQQEYLMDKQNEYNLPVNQMKRMKDAGINPNTAAASIAQGGNESAQAPQVSSNTQGAAQGLASAAGAIAGLGAMPAEVANLYAGAKQAEAAANETNALLGIKGGLWRAQTYNALMSGGLSAESARAIEIENLYRGTSLQLDLEAKRLNLPILRQTFTNLKKEYDVMVQDIKVKEQEILESGSRMSLNEANAFKAWKEGKYLEAQTFYQNGKNQIMRDFNFDPSWPSSGIILGIAADDKIDFDTANNRINAVCEALYRAGFSASQGSSEGSFDVSKGLIRTQAENEDKIHTRDTQRNMYKGLFDAAVQKTLGQKSYSFGPLSFSR